MEPGCSVVKLNFPPKSYLSLYISYGLITVITIMFPLLCNAYANSVSASIPDNSGRALKPQTVFIFILIYIFPLILIFLFCILFLKVKQNCRIFKSYILLFLSLSLKWMHERKTQRNEYLLSWKLQVQCQCLYNSPHPLSKLNIYLVGNISTAWWRKMARAVEHYVDQQQRC